MTERPAAPPTPDYPDEIGDETLEAIRRLVDSRRPAGFELTPLHPPAW
jgi:hypothetical protein